MTLRRPLITSCVKCVWIDSYRYKIFLLTIVSVVLGVEGCGLDIARERFALPIFRISEETQLTSGPGDNFYPAWSPDGRRIAFVSIRSGNWDVWVMDNDGSAQQALTTDSGLDAAPAWSPGGGTIAYASRMLDHQNVTQLLLMDLSGALPKPASMDPNTKQLLSAWSPDGRELAFIAEPMNEPAHWELQVIDIQTARTRTLVKDRVGFSSLSWHPDGGAIAFVRTASRQTREIWTITPGGADLQPILADQTNNGDPDWSPDGRMLAFSSDRSGHSEIWLLDFTTRRLQQVTTHRALARYPRWGPDGKAIAFTSNRSGRDQIWIMSIESSK